MGNGSDADMAALFTATVFHMIAMDTQEQEK